MHAQTESLISEELVFCGLNPKTLPIIKNLIKAIEYGHTALILKEEQLQLFATLPDDVLQLLSVYEGRLQIQRHHKQEKRVARKLLSMVEHKTSANNPSALMPGADESQKCAIDGAVENKLAFILGGPGTGKTSTAAAIVLGKLLQCKKPKKISLVAPTGKAAVQLSTSFRKAVSQSRTSFKPSDFPEATTIHRQLDTLNSADIVLVDEASMISLDLMDRLLATLGPHAHLILMGDPNQLASIEAGSILSTIANSTQLNNCRFTLTERHRIDGEQFLIQLQNSCLAGDPEQFFQILKSNPKTLIEYGEEAILHEYIKSAYTEYIQNLSRNHFTEPKFQVLTSTRYGLGGQKWVNQLMIDTLAQSGFYGKGNRFLVTTNQAMLGIYNGDIGYQVNDPDESDPMIHFLQLDKTIRKSQILGLELAFAISIYRSQGSEYEDICISLNQKSGATPFQPTRELLYTALTRAKRNIVIYASKPQIEIALTNPTRRLNCLELFLEKN